jgi:PilZ domain
MKTSDFGPDNQVLQDFRTNSERPEAASAPHGLRIGRPMSESRSTQRNRIFKGGAIEFDGAIIDCTIRNVSATGAALDVESPVGIPEQFTLFVNADQTQRRCRIVWRKDKRIGVRFYCRHNGHMID